MLCGRPQWESPRRKIYRPSVAGVGAVQVDEHYVGTAGRLILQVGGEAADSGSRAMTEICDQSASLIGQVGSMRESPPQASPSVATRMAWVIGARAGLPGPAGSTPPGSTPDLTPRAGELAGYPWVVCGTCSGSDAASAFVRWIVPEACSGGA